MRFITNARFKLRLRLSMSHVLGHLSDKVLMRTELSLWYHRVADDSAHFPETVGGWAWAAWGVRFLRRKANKRNLARERATASKVAPDVISWSSAISACEGSWQTALQLFAGMRQRCIKRDRTLSQTVFRPKQRHHRPVHPPPPPSKTRTFSPDFRAGADEYMTQAATITTL